MGYPRRKPAQVFLENGESLGSRDPKKLFDFIKESTLFEF